MQFKYPVLEIGQITKRHEPIRIKTQRYPINGISSYIVV